LGKDKTPKKKNLVFGGTKKWGDKGGKSLKKRFVNIQTGPRLPLKHNVRTAIGVRGGRG